ncbi:MAG: hypothetical protein ACYDBJ_03100 [Aggregatilineales bacterium]
MNRLFSRLRSRRDEPRAPDALPGFDDRVAVLYRYAQQAARYEDDLLSAQQDVSRQLHTCESRIEEALDEGQDRDALEYVRLAARLRPQYELLDHELRAFKAVAESLILRLDSLLSHLDEARVYAQSASINTEATWYLDLTLTRLTRYFVLLDRVATARRRALPERLAELMTEVLDDRRLDLVLATYVLQRRRALDAGKD